jgi:hypothetical protein
LREIIAIFPKSYAVSDEESSHLDRALITPYDNYPPRRPVRVSGLVRMLRAEGFDEFVVLFDTFKLRSLASLSGAGRCWLWTAWGTVNALDSRFSVAAAKTLFEFVRAWLRYAKVCLAVYSVSAKKR